ncbi:MAG: PilZ domain-containing protein [bacterium]|nr:PilZ domain-containing protein [bacterium]
MRFNLSINDIKYVKILLKDNHNNPELIRAAMRSVDDLEIVVCLPQDSIHEIKTPQEVTLSIVCEEGLYRTKTKLKSISIKDNFLLLFLETPSGIEYQQNREFFRVQMSYNCAYYVTMGEEVKNYTGITKDISANGVSIILPTLAVSEDDAELEMMIEERLIHTKVRYVRSEALNDKYLISFTYTDIKNSDRDYISKTCLQKQLERKRNYTSL